MKNIELQAIFNRYLENRCTAEEVQLLLNQFKTGSDSYLRQLILEELEKPDDSGDHPKLQNATAEVLVLIQQKLSQEKKRSKRRSFLKWAVAATITFTSATFIYVFSCNLQPHQPQTVVHQIHDLEPGQNKAMLTLANGKRILINDQRDQQTDPVLEEMMIKKTAEGKLIYQHSNAKEAPVLNILETPKGGQYQLQLADGTKVWLNAASKLTYPTTFSAVGTRIVQLSGEAYFEVAHHQQNPFIVKTTQQEIEVLGTEFNVKAYVNEPEQETTLLKGSVKVSVQKKAKLLIPGQQARSLKHSAEMEIISSSDTEMAVAWKSGVFLFDKSDIEQVMRQVTRWYDAEVIYEGKKPDVKFTGVLQKDKKLSQILAILQLAGKVKFKIQGNKIFVKN